MYTLNLMLNIESILGPFVAHIKFEFYLLHSNILLMLPPHRYATTWNASTRHASTTTRRHASPWDEATSPGVETTPTTSHGWTTPSRQ